jgi:hypothetical protein
MVFSIAPVLIQIGSHGKSVMSIRMIGRFVQDIAVESASFFKVISSERCLSVSDQSGVAFDGRQFSVSIF